MTHNGSRTLPTLAPQTPAPRQTAGGPNAPSPDAVMADTWPGPAWPTGGSVRDPRHQRLRRSEHDVSVVGDDELESPVEFGAVITKITRHQRGGIVRTDRRHRPLAGQGV